jgi:hypothetical protein
MLIQTRLTSKTQRFTRVILLLKVIVILIFVIGATAPFLAVVEHIHVAVTDFTLLDIPSIIIQTSLVIIWFIVSNVIEAIIYFGFIWPRIVKEQNRYFH